MFLLSVQSLSLMFAEDLSVSVFSLQRDVVEGTANFTPFTSYCCLPCFCFNFLDQVNVAHSVSKGFHLVCVLIFEKKTY